MFVCCSQNKPFAQFIARRATFSQSGYCGTEATSFAARGFVFLPEGNRVLCMKYGRPAGDHWVSDPVMGPSLKIRQYCVERRRGEEESSELSIH